MKKMSAFLAAAAVLVYTGCNILEEPVAGSEETTEKIEVQKENSIAVVVKGSSNSRATFNVQEHTTMKAEFVLMKDDPYAESVYRLWGGGDNDTLYFPMDGIGSYILTVIEYDENAEAYESSHKFEIKESKLYEITVSLGGALKVNVDTGDKTPVTKDDEILSNAKWYTEEDSTNGSYSTVEYGDSAVYAMLSGPDAALLCEPATSMKGYSSVALNCQNGQETAMKFALVDTDGNHFQVRIRTEHFYKLNVISFNDFRIPNDSTESTIDPEKFSHFSFAAEDADSTVWFSVNDLFFVE